MAITDEAQADNKPQPPVRAISICIYDPTGKDTGKTFPEGSVWMLDKERRQEARDAELEPTQESQPVPDLHSCSCCRPRPSKYSRTWEGAPFGITLADLQAWDGGQLRDLAFRLHWPHVRPEEADRFGEKLQHLLPKAAAPKRSCGRYAGEVITAAWRYALQVIDNTKAENPTKSEEAAVAVTPARKASEVTRSSKDRVKRYRAKRKNWSPENLSIHQAVKARNRSGNHLCYVCGRADTAPHHIIPRSEGGLPLADNIIWLCNPHHEEVEGPYGGPVGAWDRINLAKAEYRAQAA